MNKRLLVTAMLWTLLAVSIAATVLDDETKLVALTAAQVPWFTASDY